MTLTQRFAPLDTLSTAGLATTIRDVQAFGWLAASWFAAVRS
jgi:hypothetical protein